MLGAAAVAIWCDVAFDVKDEYDDWHAHEHMPERLSIPGFLRGTRWVSTDGRNAYCMLYEAQEEATVTAGRYLERLNDPTPWSRKMMAHHRNMVRSLCRVRASFGAGLGQFLLSVRCSPDPRNKEDLETWLGSELLPGVASRKGCVTAHFLQNIPAQGSEPTAEQKLRGGDAAADWIVLISGYSAEALEAMAAAEFSEAHLTARGALPGSAVRCYGLACLMTAADVRRGQGA
jgi:hypothetical protein